METSIAGFYSIFQDFFNQGNIRWLHLIPINGKVGRSFSVMAFVVQKTSGSSICAPQGDVVTIKTQSDLNMSNGTWHLAESNDVQVVRPETHRY